MDAKEGTKKILIVDDQDSIRELVSETLAGVGNYVILRAESGEQALEIIAKENPQLIFMDLMMPGGMSGLEAIRRIKANPKLKGHVVALTAMGQKADIARGYEAGADDYFIKPFSPLELIKKTEEILGQG